MHILLILRGENLLVLITYDVSTKTAKGVKRLSKVAKVCTNYGQRVQNSVFECLVDRTQFAMLKKQISDIIDKDADSIRYYILGDNYNRHVEHVGAKKTTKQPFPNRDLAAVNNLMCSMTTL